MGLIAEQRSRHVEDDTQIFTFQPHNESWNLRIFMNWVQPQEEFRSLMFPILQFISPTFYVALPCLCVHRQIQKELTGMNTDRGGAVIYECTNKCPKLYVASVPSQSRSRQTEGLKKGDSSILYRVSQK